MMDRSLLRLPIDRDPPRLMQVVTFEGEAYDGKPPYRFSRLVIDLLSDAEEFAVEVWLEVRRQSVPPGDAA